MSSQAAGGEQSWGALPPRPLAGPVGQISAWLHGEGAPVWGARGRVSVGTSQQNYFLQERAVAGRAGRRFPDGRRKGGRENPQTIGLAQLCSFPRARHCSVPSTRGEKKKTEPTPKTQQKPPGGERLPPLGPGDVPSAKVKRCLGKGGDSRGPVCPPPGPGNPTSSATLAETNYFLADILARVYIRRLRVPPGAEQYGWQGS